ncbi:hypothetical protein Tco_1427978 [Tanacetum coccineum]
MYNPNLSTPSLERQCITITLTTRQSSTRDKDPKPSLKNRGSKRAPVPTYFEQGDKQTLNPLGPIAAHWSNYIGEVVRSVPLHLFDSAAHRILPLDRDQRRHQHALAKSHNTNKAFSMPSIGRQTPLPELRSGGGCRRARPEEITAAEDPTLARLRDEWQASDTSGVPFHSLTPSSEHTLLMMGGSGGCGDDEEGGDDEDGDSDD